MTTRLRLVAAPLALGVTASLLAISGPSLASAPPLPTQERGHHHGHHGHKHKGKVVWDVTTLTAGTGTPVAAHGRVPGGKKKVKLQVKVPGSWRTFGKTRSNRKGKFAISGYLDWYGIHKIRVATKGRKAFHKTTTASVFASYVPRGNPADHAYLTEPDGIRYSFDPCKTVRYAVNADDVGPNGIVLAQLGMAQLSYATGIKVKYVGTTHQIPLQTAGERNPKGQDLVIGWATEQEIPAFPTTPAIGFGGSTWIRDAKTAAGHRVHQTLEAGVVLDTNAYLDTNTYSQGFIGPKPTWGEVIIHELGHAFGLGHVSAADEIMNPQAGNGPYPDGLFRGLYDAGDLTGLAISGLGQGCFKPVRSKIGSERVAPLAPQP